MLTAATTASHALATLKDPTGRKRAQARRQLLLSAGAAAAGSLLAFTLAAIERRRRRSAKQQSAFTPPQRPRTAGTTDAAGHYRSRHGVGAAAGAGVATGPILHGERTPLDVLAAKAQRLQSTDAAEPGFNAHMGFGIGGSIPAPRIDDAVPTGGGDALGGTLRGRAGTGSRYGDEIVTGAGEAITNSTTPSQNGHGSLH